MQGLYIHTKERLRAVQVLPNDELEKGASFSGHTNSDIQA
jgi:hypothetical protein